MPALQKRIMMSAPLIDSTAASQLGAIRSRTGLGRLSLALFLASLAVFIPQLGTTIVILPAQLAVLDPDNKVTLVAMFTAIAAVIGFLAIVTFGYLSDRTRGRLGRRTPWIIVGGITIAAGCLLLSFANSIPMLFVGYLVESLGVASLLGALNPVVPDRVPVARRGVASTALGAGVLIGGTLGVLICSALAADSSLAFLVLAGIAIVMTGLYVLLAPDFDNRDQPRAPRSSPLAVFAFPRNAPDFYWAFFGRLAVILGYYVVGGYQLFILTDYVRMDSDAAVALLGTAALVNAVGSIIGALAGGPLSDLLNRRKGVTIASAAIMGLGILIPLFSATSLFFLIYMGVAGIGLGMFFSVDAALLSQVLPSDGERGKDLGLLALATNGGQVIGPLVGSFVVTVSGFSPIFVVGFALCIVGGALLAPIKSVR